jgi:hypothetical protein
MQKNSFSALFIFEKKTLFYYFFLSLSFFQIIIWLCLFYKNKNFFLCNIKNSLNIFFIIILLKTNLKVIFNIYKKLK